MNFSLNILAKRWWLAFRGLRMQNLPGSMVAHRSVKLFILSIRGMQIVRGWPPCSRMQTVLIEAAILLALHAAEAI
jgi:hypothetical protein